MNKLKILTLTFSTFACGQTTKTVDHKIVVDSTIVKTDTTQKYTVTKATITNFKNAKSNFKEKILMDTSKITKKEKIIHLPTDHGNVVFKDTLAEGIGEEDFREYRYIGQFEKVGLFIISGSFWEHYECYLIDKRTGKITTIWDNPALSPDGNFIANLSLPYGLEGLPNGIQIWRISKQSDTKIEKFFEIDQQVWAPTEMFWETDKTIILKVADTKKFDNKNGTPEEKDFYYLRLRIN